MNARQQLQWLLEDKYGWTRQVSLDAVSDQASNSAQFSDEILSDIIQLREGIPLAYVIGWVMFLDCKIDLRFKPLIPRPETEHWVGEFLRLFRPGATARVLDLCSGSGCIAAAVLHHLPDTEVVAVDIDPQAVTQTKQNLETVNSAGTWQVTESDLFERVTGSFDFILSNPPYVDRAGEYDQDVLHEPDQAVFAEDRGLAMISQIISQAEKFLRPGGQLWLEFATDQGSEVMALATAAGLRAELKKDQYDKDRYAIITR